MTADGTQAQGGWGPPDSAHIGPQYAGPPPTTPPPLGWRPPTVVRPSPARRLPPQDHVAIDADEARSRTTTLGIAGVAAAIMVIMLAALCGRWLF